MSMPAEQIQQRLTLAELLQGYVDAPDLPGALRDRATIDGETVAYRCLGTHCEMPVTTWEALAVQLSETAAE